MPTIQDERDRVALWPMAPSRQMFSRPHVLPVNRLLAGYVRPSRHHDGMAHEDHSARSKQFALRRDVHCRDPLSVYNDADWDLMHGANKLPTGDLICPEPGCRAELVGVQNKDGTRFLRNRPGSSGCGHASGGSRGGGRPSEEHSWLQRRLIMLCSDLGYKAIPEHYESRADVWVASTPPLAIEIQRWGTNFAKRTAARQFLGANVLWLLPESASRPKAGELFRWPAARIRVYDRGDRTQSAKPWLPGHSGRVLLWIGATVLRPRADGRAFESAGNYDAKTFLREIIEEKRRWYGPDEEGFQSRPGWARLDDVDQVRAALRRAAMRRPSSAAPVPAASTQAPAIDLARIQGLLRTAQQSPTTPTVVPAAAIPVPDTEDQVRPDAPASDVRDQMPPEWNPVAALATGSSAEGRWRQRLRAWCRRNFQTVP